MKQPQLALTTLSLALIFTGCVLQNWIPLTLNWKHDVGMMAFYFGLIFLLRIFIKPVTDKIMK